MCCGFIIRKYLPAIKKQRDDECMRRRLLEESCNDLKKSLIDAEDIHKEQVAGSYLLFNRVELWKKEFEYHNNKRKDIQEKLFKEACEKHKKQIMAREVQKIQERMLPLVIALAQEDLKKKFSQQSAVEYYNDICIHKLESKRGL